VSYLGRHDLAHVEPAEFGFDAVGKGVGAGAEPEQAPAPVPAARIMSTGYVRQRNLSNVVVIPGGAMVGGSAAVLETRGETAIAEAAVAVAYGQSAVAATSTAVTYAYDDRLAVARLKGYVGESCSECGNFTMVRNGTCLKCDTCGSTSGCS
jgi:ribonucleoside-diphosphate reductase alpha chain